MDGYVSLRGCALTASQLHLGTLRLLRGFASFSIKFAAFSLVHGPPNNSNNLRLIL